MDLLVYFFAFIFILIFPIGNLITFTFVQSANITLLDIFTLLIFLYWVIFKDKNTKIKLYYPIIIFVGVLLISYVVNIYWIPFNMLGSAFLYIVRWLLYLSFFFMMLSSSKKISIVIPYLMSGGGLLTVIIGYIQYFFYPSLQNFYKYGWDEHLYRLFAGFLDPNFCGMILALVFILNFQFLSKLSTFRFKIIFIIIQCLTVLAVLLTYSRTAVVVLVFATAFFLLLNKKKKLIMYFVILLAIFIYFLPIISGRLNVQTFKIENTNFLRITSVNARIKAFNEGMMLFSKHPFFGVGFNNLRYAQYKEKIIGGPNWQATHAGGGTDNSFLFIAETTGIIGLIAYLYLLYAIFKELLKKKSNLASITISSLVGVIAGSFFINGLFYSFIMLWLWSLIGISLRNKP